MLRHLSVVALFLLGLGTWYSNSTDSAAPVGESFDKWAAEFTRDWALKRPQLVSHANHFRAEPDGASDRPLSMPAIPSEAMHATRTATRQRPHLNRHREERTQLAARRDEAVVAVRAIPTSFEYESPLGETFDTRVVTLRTFVSDGHGAAVILAKTTLTTTRRQVPPNVDEADCATARVVPVALPGVSYQSIEIRSLTYYPAWRPVPRFAERTTGAI